MNVTMDQLDQLAASAFDGYLVRKDLVRKYARQYPVPTYVVEFLLGRYCASTDEQEIAEGLEIVEKQLRDRTVRTGEEELFKARAKEHGSVKLIDIVRQSERRLVAPIMSYPGIRFTNTPALPPFDPSPPLPVTRMDWPAWTPLGMRTW